MACLDGVRRVVRMTVPAGGSEIYMFEELPLADPLLHIPAPASEANVDVDLSCRRRDLGNVARVVQIDPGPRYDGASIVRCDPHRVQPRRSW